MLVRAGTRAQGLRPDLLLGSPADKGKAPGAARDRSPHDAVGIEVLASSLKS